MNINFSEPNRVRIYRKNNTLDIEYLNVLAIHEFSSSELIKLGFGDITRGNYIMLEYKGFVGTITATFKKTKDLSIQIY